jgi:hypothetical protein
MSYEKCTRLRILLLLIGIASLAIPVHGFVANSLDITVDTNGNAIAVFRFTLEGVVENAIPQSILQSELLKGLSTSAEPPTLISMDRSSATLQLNNFADKTDVPTGTNYQTTSMDFSKAEIALKNSGLSSVITANFAPQVARVTFPDGYSKEFSNAPILPSVSHTVIDPSKHPQGLEPANNGTLNITTTPSGAQVYIDDSFIGISPATLTGILPGTHNLSFVKEGFEPSSRIVTVTAGTTTQVSVAFNYTPTPTTTPGFGFLIAGIAMIGCFCILKKRSS